MELQKHTLNLRKGDYETIQAYFAHREIRASVIIRKIVSRFVDELINKEPDTEVLKINIPGLKND